MARPLSRKRKRAIVVEMLDVHRTTGMAHEPLLGFLRLLPGASAEASRILGNLQNAAGHEASQVEELRRLVASIWTTRRMAAEDAADAWSLDDIEAAMVKAGIWPKGKP